MVVSEPMSRPLEVLLNADLSHLHQLFSVETCHTYIHALRWKDRPLQCPRCQSHHAGPWGAYHYQPGLQRYRCKEQACKRTFNDLTWVRSWTAASARCCTGFWPPSCCACRSSRRIARELGMHRRTGYRWPELRMIDTRSWRSIGKKSE